MSFPLVSVCVFSYNYEKYIIECLDSILKQETSFEFEVIVGDDHSTDNTRLVIEDYIKENPGRIRLLAEEPNMGGTRNWIRTMNAAKGKYLALIDGDDYFIQKNKLQLQFDMLESNPNTNLCFHGVKETFEIGPVKEKEFISEKESYTVAEILKQGWFIRTGSLFFRNYILPSTPPEWVYEYPYRYDTILIVYLTISAPAINIKNVMSVWRHHGAGLSYVITKNRMENYRKERGLYLKLNDLTKGAYKAEINFYIKIVRTHAFAFLFKRLALGELSKFSSKELCSLDYSFLVKDFFSSIFRKISK